MTSNRNPFPFLTCQIDHPPLNTFQTFSACIRVVGGGLNFQLVLKFVAVDFAGGRDSGFGVFFGKLFCFCFFISCLSFSATIA